MKKSASKYIALALAFFILAQFVLPIGNGVREARAQFNLLDFLGGLLDIGGGTSGCELVGLFSGVIGGFGDFVPVCEVNPRIVKQPGGVFGDLFGDLFTSITGTGSILGNEVNNTIYQQVQLPLLELFKLEVIDILTNQIVAWVTGGDSEENHPQFIRDWEQYLGVAYDIGFYSVANEIDASNACPTIKSQLISGITKDLSPVIAIDRNQLLDPLSFISQMGCTMTDPAAFSQSFSNGGWDEYAAQILDPQNTLIGALMMSSDEAQLRASSKANATQQEGVANSGYYPVKRCLQIDPITGGCLQTQVTSPGSVYQSALDASLKSRFDMIVNSSQFTQLLIIVAESFLNQIIGQGVDSLFGLLTNATTNQNPGIQGYVNPNTTCNGLDPSACQIQNQTPYLKPVPPGATGASCTSNTQCNAGLVCVAGACQ